MTTRRDIEPILDRWLAEGPARIADRVVFGALETVDHTEQLRRPRWVGRANPLSHTRRLAIAAAVAIVIGGGTLLALAVRSGPSVGGRIPSPTAVALYLPRMTQGVVYRTPPFTPSFTITGVDGWYLVAATGPGTAYFAKGPNEPSGPDDLNVALIHPNQVLPVGGGHAQPLPTDLIGWLQARSDLLLQAPRTALVGGMPARIVDGTVVPTAKVNSDGNVSLLCAVGPCDFNFGSDLGVALGSHFEIMVVDVRGQTVVIRIDSPESTWASGRHELDDFLSTLTFPE